jgi:hypothetical protein
LIFEYWLSGKFPSGDKGDELRSILRDIGIGEEPSHYSILAAAVGRLLVGWDKDAFDVWSTEEMTEGRDAFPSKSLLSINWADGSTADWPANYDLFTVLEYDCNVVVTSGDEAPFGYRDFALGHFPTKENRLKASEKIIVSNWLTLASEFDQQRWCKCWGRGLVKKADAEQWAGQVWAADDDDEYNDEE